VTISPPVSDSSGFTHDPGGLNTDRLAFIKTLKTERRGSANLPPSFPKAIEIISRASVDPKSIEDEAWDFEDQLRDKGFSESEIDELLGVGFFSILMNMLTDTYDAPWESPFPPE